MARCDQGYLCEVCGLEVEDITDSDLYLRYVLGEVDPETLHQSPERHLRCNPSLSQFIDDPDFEPVEVEGPFSKHDLDAEYVAEETGRVSTAYRKLQEIYRSSRNTPITEYLEPEIQARWLHRSAGAAPNTEV